MSKIEAVSGEPSRLGECPLWCDRTRRLWWVDVLTPALWSHDPSTGVTRSHAVAARRLGSLALLETGGLLLACDDGLHVYDPASGEQRFLLDPEPGRPGHRKNDGRADSGGSFWIGTLRERDYAPVGALYRVAPDLTVSMVARDLAIPNALAFDPDRGRMYYGDTRAYRIWVCDYDPVSGRVGDRRIFATTTAPARPDGSCTDAEGCVWNAEYAGGRVVRYAPSGEVLRVVELPVSHPTCCCFGGDALDRLYVTSAREPLTDQQAQAEPLAGRVLILDVGVTGRREFRARLRAPAE
jgi:sugar lactone lactonase YvrE